MKEEIQVYIQDLLKQLAILIPTEGSARHVIYLNENGQLSISMLINGMWQDVWFDNDYVDINAVDLANEIKVSIDNIK